MDYGTGDVVQEPHPGWFSVFLQLMKLRVIILLQVTAVCAILVHDLVIDLERTWMDTLLTVGITVVGGTLSAGGSNAINMWYDADIDPLMRRTKTAPSLKAISRVVERFSLASSLRCLAPRFSSS